MNGYHFSRIWFDFSFVNTHRVRPTHTAVYLFAVERCNRLGWKEEFAFPTDLAMEALGIRNYRTYIKTLQDLADWGFVKWIQRSQNQYTANVIALVKKDEPLPQALDKALLKQEPKQVQSIASIDKQINNKQLNQETIFKKPLLRVHKSEIPKDYRNYFDWAVKFQELFLRNLKNKGAPHKKLELVSLQDSAEPIRLMVEQDGVSQDQLQLAYDLLNGSDEFWKAIILDTNKLRNRIGQLIAQGKKPINVNKMDLKVQQKIKSYD